MTSTTLKALADTLSAGPDHYCVIPVPSLPPFADEFVLPTSVDSRHLKAAISSGLPIVLAPQIDPTSEATAAGLQGFAVKASLMFRGPENGRVACVFETGAKIHVKYSNVNGSIRATTQSEDFWKI